MPAIITHHLFGEDAATRLPEGIIDGQEELLAFLLGNQGPDPFWAHFVARRSVAAACAKLATDMHAGKVVEAFMALHDAVTHLPEDDKRVPFCNMIYIGDGLSDVPCMKMMKAYGGTAIAVWQDNNRRKVEELLLSDRVDYIFPADYSKQSKLDSTVHHLIKKIAIADELTSWEDGKLVLDEDESTFWATCAKHELGC
jgi:hypothetical protein